MQTLRSALDFLGGPGPVALAIALLFATPVIDRVFVRRKRVNFRVLYNSKIGLGPEQLHDGTESQPSQLRELVRVLDRMSIVVVRVRNSGNYDIDADDWDKALTFTFGERVVWNARVSEAGSDDLREEVRRSLQFFGADTARRVSLPTVRERMAQLVARWGRLAVVAEPGEQVWHGVRLEGLALRRKQKFKLLVVLREPETNDGPIGKDVRIEGRLGGVGIVHDEKRRRVVTLPRLTGGIAAVLAAVLVLTLAWPGQSSDPTVACASGSLKVTGSSVFLPTVRPIVDQYRAACPDADITVESTGSKEGAREVAALGPADTGSVLAFSDGAPSDADVTGRRVAIVVYHVVVNGSVGLETVTLDQLRGIYAGRYRNWSELGGAALPIRVVGRDGDSGSRQLFERVVLKAAEPAISSDDCRVADRDPTASVIRCERPRNADVVREVGATEGAIGYADAPSVAEPRKAKKIVALSLDGRAFDAAAGVDEGYPFWTVEYVLTKGQPAEDSLSGRFLRYLLEHDDARVRMKDAGYLPCRTADGDTLSLCGLR
ncbi:hypothetical protein GCM10022243_36140 [Saccharothrix violaceirubra]|uniref:ABC-type phosphate transport system substrate-binding protein n=1 Tax=Saccharothrix violaceirubra TaxID=413306 RepID=A0A7W7T0X0_9PSEU|nr:substrate-binding domain-containing protein [Saccharothrix violaceirubra]MBB4963987.1 ABC-type phosphate transport system substrate-binding protein [Saccharothrix violaceirubra]